MREFKFDMDIILRNCERYGVKVETGEKAHGVTMNGKPFDVTEEITKAFKELSASSSITTSSTTKSSDTTIQNTERSHLMVTVGTTRTIMPEQVSFTVETASLRAA